MATGIKYCIDCSKEYKPTSKVQKRCTECKEKAKASKKPARKARPGQAPQPHPPRKSRLAAKPAEGAGNACGCDGCKRLNMAFTVLVTTGLISQETVEDTRAYVAKLI